jgi:hypothetical protein
VIGMENALQSAKIHHRNLVRLLTTPTTLTVCPRVSRAEHKVSGQTNTNSMVHYKTRGV